MAIQLLNRLPSSWRSKRLKYAAPLRTSRVVGSSNDSEYIGLENIESWTGRYLPSSSPFDIGNEETAVSGTTSCFSNGDVLFGKLRPYLAKALLAKRDGTCSTELLVLQPGRDLDARFLFYVLLCPEFVTLVDSSTFGAKMPRANWDFIGNVRFPLPNLEDQRNIVSYLEAQTMQIDSLIAEKERMLALLVEKRAMVVSQAVTRGLKPDISLKVSGLHWLIEIPAHWQVMQLKRTWLSAEYGISENIRDEGVVKVLRMSCIVDGRIDLTNAGQVEEVPKHLLLHEGDILFNRTNSLDQVAKVGLLDVEPEMPTSFASYLVRIQARHDVSNEYLTLLLNSQEFLKYARCNAIPAISQANLSPSRYGDIKIPLPPRNEQDEIVAFVSSERARTAELEANMQHSLALLKERRSALITAAVTGQIEPEVMTA